MRVWQHRLRMVDSVACCIHGGAVWQVADGVHKLGAGKRGSGDVLVRGNGLGMVDGISCPVHRRSVRQVTHVVEEVEVGVGILLKSIGRILHGNLRQRSLLPTAAARQGWEQKPGASNRP